MGQSRQGEEIDKSQSKGKELKSSLDLLTDITSYNNRYAYWSF